MLFLLCDGKDHGCSTAFRSYSGLSDFSSAAVNILISVNLCASANSAEAFNICKNINTCNYRSIINFTIKN